MSPTKPTAHTMVSKVMPINAKNAARLRVMPGVYTYRLSLVSTFLIDKETLYPSQRVLTRFEVIVGRSGW